MAHKQLEDGRVVIDWETGDQEGDRRFLFLVFTDFINELLQAVNEKNIDKVKNVIKNYNISTENQVDDFPRIWISKKLTDE